MWLNRRLWFRIGLTAAVVAIASDVGTAIAQVRQPARPNLPATQPQVGRPRVPGLIVHPQINAAPNPGFNQIPPFGPADPFNPFGFYPPNYTPPVVNPWPVYRTPTLYYPPVYNPVVNPWVPPPVVNPWQPNPFVNPWISNPWQPNPWQPNPWQPNPWQPNPLAPNPWVMNQFAGGNNLGIWQPGLGNPTPTITVKQPGILVPRGPDLQVNPVAGVLYKPNTGVAVMRDGSTFVRVPGTGVPNIAGGIVPGSELLYDAEANRFFNPKSGLVTQVGNPGFLPYIR